MPHGLDANADDPLLFICPVRPEWTDPTGLTGYYDVLTNRYVVPPFLEAVLEATAQRNSPVFVILDEMNLARVEYYLSDVLSCIETGSPLQLHSSGVPLEGTTGTSIRAELPLPTNLFIIGTINVDERTNPVSDKVLDRASVIDMSAVDVPGFLASLVARNDDLKDARAAIEPKLTEIHGLLQQHGLGLCEAQVEHEIAGLDVAEVAALLGRAFAENRLMTLFIITLPAIGLSERFGLQRQSAALRELMAGFRTADGAAG